MDDTISKYAGPAAVGGLHLPLLHIRVYEDAGADLWGPGSVGWEAEATFRQTEVPGFTMEWASSGEVMEIALPGGEKGRVCVESCEYGIDSRWTLGLSGIGMPPSP